MAEKEPIIVIKKINVVKGAHHGGSWKVAFADFMTAMMAFFLVMWLISQTEDVKKNVADYFSTPSVIEYNFSNYGVELTLEKLFLDLINEPLKVLQAFITPADYTPNVMAMGSKKIALHHMAEQLGDNAGAVEVNSNEIKFEIPADKLFVPGTAKPNKLFVEVMEKVNGITAGLEDSNVYIDSEIFKESVSGQSETKARNVADERLDIITAKVEAKLEHQSVDIFGKTIVKKKNQEQKTKPTGMLKFRIKQKVEDLKDRKPREFDELFGQKDGSMNVYDNFVNQLSKRKESQKQ